MNKCSVYAWLDDLQMSAQLAKLAYLNSYEFNFVEENLKIDENTIPTIIIVDLMKLSVNDLKKLSSFPKTELLTIIGYLSQITAPQVKYYQDYGCQMVIGRNELLKNLDSILKKIFHAN